MVHEGSGCWDLNSGPSNQQPDALNTELPLCCWIIYQDTGIINEDNGIINGDNGIINQDTGMVNHDSGMVKSAHLVKTGSCD